MKNKKRIFIGIKVNESEIAGIKRNISDELMNKLPVKWIENKNIHITLVPPWYEDEKNIKKITKIIEKIAEIYEPFEIRLEKIEIAPSKRPNLVWVMVSQSTNLEVINNKLCKLMNIKTGRKFIPHITLARANNSEHKKMSKEKASIKIDSKLKVNSITLLESKLSPDGAEYETIYQNRL